MLCGGVRVASGDWDLVDDTIVVLRCRGGGWSGVDLVGDGELEGMVLGEALGYIETANGFRKRWPCEWSDSTRRCTGLVTPQHKHGPVWVQMSYFRPPLV